MDSQANTVIHQETVETRMRKTRSSIISEWIPITSKNSDIQQGITIQVTKALVNHYPPCRFTRPYLDIYACISALFHVSPTNHSK